MTEEQIQHNRELIAALRSGAYKQGRGQLRKYDSFCCLGVACDLYAKQKGLKWNDENNSFLDSEMVLPKDVADWLGVRKELGPILNGRGDTAAEINDSCANFREIANLWENWLANQVVYEK